MLKVPILVQLAAVNNEIPTEAEVELVVRGLKSRRAVCSSGMRTEDMKGWRKKAKRENDTVGRRWEVVVQLVQVMFRYGTVPEEIAWVKMVLVLKGKREYRGLRIVEVLWKVCSVVVNCRLKRSVVLHDALCGFREGIGTGTETLDVKLAQKLARLAHKPLFRVFLYVRKVYDSFDREGFLELLRG